MTGLDPTRVGPVWPMDALVSYHYYKDERVMGALVETGRLRMIGDSGAFSALTSGNPIRLPDFCAWARQWAPHMAWIAALDVIGDPVATLANWTTMRERHGLDVVPTLHVGTDPAAMEPYVAQGVDFFGLGGMVGRALTSRPWLARVFLYARERHPHVRFHLWGMTNRDIIDNLPAYSADSSGFGAGHRFARFTCCDPATGKMHNIKMRTSGMYAEGQLLRRVYGVDPAWVTHPTRANRALVMKIYARSYQLLAEWQQRRHATTPPLYGLGTPLGGDKPPGTRIHAVEAPSGMLTAVHDLTDADAAALTAISAGRLTSGGTS